MVNSDTKLSLGKANGTVIYIQGVPLLTQPSAPTMPTHLCDCQPGEDVFVQLEIRVNVGPLYHTKIASSIERQNDHFVSSAEKEYYCTNAVSWETPLAHVLASSYTKLTS